MKCGRILQQHEHSQHVNEGTKCVSELLNHLLVVLIFIHRRLFGGEVCAE